MFRNGVNMLYGQITREDLFNEFPSWKSKYDDYNPDKNIIGSLPERQKDLKVEIYLGTWCGDSKREVPRFFKITDQSHFIDQKNISIWAVDRSKSLDSGLTEKKNIELVATFIFLKNEIEIGRIIESPINDLLEEDILAIMRGD